MPIGSGNFFREIEMDKVEPIQWVPLHAEAREKYSHWYKPELNPGCEGRAKFLYE